MSKAKRAMKRLKILFVLAGISTIVAICGIIYYYEELDSVSFWLDLGCIFSLMLSTINFASQIRQRKKQEEEKEQK